MPNANERGGLDAVRLTVKQRRFADEYVGMAPYYNATEAAVRAGYAPQGSRVNARNEGRRLMKNALVLDYIDALREEAAIRNSIRLDDIINQLFKIAYFDIRTLYYEDGTLKPVHELSADAAAAIAAIEIEDMTIGSGNTKIVIGTKTKYQLKNGLEALKALAEMLGYKAKEKIVRRNANGEIIETETSETIIESHKVVFEDYTEQMRLNPSTNADTDKAGL